MFLLATDAVNVYEVDSVYTMVIIDWLVSSGDSSLIQDEHPFFNNAMTDFLLQNLLLLVSMIPLFVCIYSFVYRKHNKTVLIIPSYFDFLETFDNDTDAVAPVPTSNNIIDGIKYETNEWSPIHCYTEFVLPNLHKRSRRMTTQNVLTTETSVYRNDRGSWCESKHCHS